MTPTRRPPLASVFVALALVAVVGACRTPSLPGVPPRGTLRAVEDPAAQQHFRNHLALARQRVALRGHARVALEGPDFALNRPMRIALERPGRLRFEIVALFDQLAAILVTDGARFQSYDASTGRVTGGRITPTLLWDLTKLDLAPGEAVGLLLGAPLPSLGTRRAAVWEESGGHLALAYAWPDEAWTARAAASGGRCAEAAARTWLDPACFLDRAAARRALADGGGEVFVFDTTGRLREIRALEADGVLRYRAVYAGFEPLEPPAGASGEAAPFAREVTIHSPALDARARFAWKRVMLAAELSDRLFTLPRQLGSAR